MGVVDRLIYNSLAARRGVNLPGVGSLSVEQSAARLEGNRLIIPAVKIVYSADLSEGLKDVATLLCEVNGGDASAAEAMYEAWEERKGHDEKLVISGVGEIVHGKFVPEAAFDALLNPHRGAPTASRSRARCGRRMRVILLPALLGIAVGLGVYLFIDKSGLFGDDDLYAPTVSAAAADATPAESGEQTDSSTEAVIELSVKENAAAGNLLPAEPAGSSAARSATSGAAAADTKPAGNSSASVKPANAVTGPKYYVVAGVFSTEANADRCIAQINSELLNVAPEKIPYAGGKILVSLYSTPDAEEAADKMRLWRSWSESLWVYKR